MNHKEIYRLLDRYPLPYQRWQQNNKPNRDHVQVEVGGDVSRIGKSTAVKVLVEGLRVMGRSIYQSDEDWIHNPHLTESYSDPQHGFLLSQQWFANRKWEQLTASYDSEIFIQDVHPEMDYVYAFVGHLTGRMNATQFSQYQRFFYALDWRHVSAPDLLIYLTASDNVLLDRIQHSARDFEKFDPDYVLTMKSINRFWIDSHPDDSRLLVIDTDNFDFSTDVFAQQQLVDRVAERLLPNVS